MSRGIYLALLICASVWPSAAFAEPNLAAAVLPTSRATQVNNTVTAFATVINAGPNAGEECGITLNSGLPIDFSYQTTNSADNSLTGTANTPVNLAVGEAQSFVMSFAMTGTFGSTDVEPVFACSNGGPAGVLSGVNTILLTSTSTGIPDMIALVATLGNTGYTEIEGANGTGVFSVATSNVGAAGSLTVTADTGQANTGVNILLCETDPSSGDCINPTTPSAVVNTEAATGSTQTFAIFVQGNGQDVVDNPAINRTFVRFLSDGVTTGLTSVAMRTVAAPVGSAPTEPTPTLPAPTEPAPTEPAPTEPAPTQPAPTEPAPTEPAPTEPAPVNPNPVVPAPTEPAPTEPAPTEPAPTEPAPTEPAPTEPAPTEPAPTEPTPTEPPPPIEPTAEIGVWANDGGDKVVQEEIRSFSGGDTSNSVWDGSTIRTFGARNEVVAFNVVVDNNGADLFRVAVDFSRLTNGGYTLETTDSTATDLFDWTDRPIEVFSVGYLKIFGLSRIAYDLYDETHVPEEMRRPFTSFQPAAPAIGSGGWEDRANHDRSYPDIAEPIEIRGSTPLAGGNSQSFWVDVYIPKDAPAGTLRGELNVTVGDVVQRTIPVEILVADVTLPDERESKTMLHMDGQQIAERFFLGISDGVVADSDDAQYRQIVNNHYKLAWRHGISITDLNQQVPDKILPADRPNDDWANRLTGGLYTAANGYDGPGQNLAHDVFSIGSYGNWSGWWGVRRFDPEATDVFDATAPLSELRDVIEFRTDQWETWFQNNAPDTDRYLYVDDEPEVSFIRSGPRLPIEYADIVSRFVKENPGPGGNLDTFITASPLDYDSELPNTNILGTVISVGQTEIWEGATAGLNADPERRYFMYNGRRPASGTFATEDDGVALRELAWGQYKTGVSRWFYWNANYWNNFLGGPPVRNLTEVDPDGAQFRNGTRTNVFQSAHTFGSHDFFDPVIGETGVFNYSNGDGVLLYPGTDRVFPAESRGIDGPIASLRMKHWRRGIQDVQYISLAMQINPTATQAIIDSIIPEVLWEVGVADDNDPTFVHEPPSWSTDPVVWERARAQLLNIIAGSQVVDPDEL